MNEHIRFLKHFNDVFQEIDENKSGVIDQMQLRLLLLKMNQKCREVMPDELLFSTEDITDQINEVVSFTDPYDTDKITYSWLISSLSLFMDQRYYNDISLLERYIEITLGIIT